VTGNWGFGVFDTILGCLNVARNPWKIVGEWLFRDGRKNHKTKNPDDPISVEALTYHREPIPGKISIAPTKPLSSQQDLALAYSPGVAAPSRVIAASPSEARNLTARSNLVAVISNGTAVLGLGDIGPLAAKPVMEGKAVLFKTFAGIDAFDLEVNETDPEKLAEIIVSLEPTFGGVNLEDIKAPDCFLVEEICRKRMSIPVFHDDQHGTAICVVAAVQNALRLSGKDIGNVRLVCSGAGAAAIACLDLLVAAGLRKSNILVTDRNGVIHSGRKKGMNPLKRKYAAKTKYRSLEQSLEDADIFLGLSSAGILKANWLGAMLDNPLILALANPDPEIMPMDAKAARPDAIIATGRSDFPNQVNNVLCFPFLFRGALDSGATEVTQAMKLAAAVALADLGRSEVPDSVQRLYPQDDLTFGPQHILPKPFDPRLLPSVSSAVAEAARTSKVATQPITDLDSYRRKLSSH